MATLTLQNILQSQLDSYLALQPLPPHLIKSLKQIRDCRTSKMGSHSDYCNHGHLLGVYHNSCRCRACPQCQKLANARWLEKQKAKLLNTQHHHVIFTIPHDYNSLWMYNKRWFNDLLFQSVRHAINTLAKDPKYLGAKPGFILALHTWGRSLSVHPHIHCLVAHGGLSDTGKWVAPKRDILFPQRVLGRLFRQHLLKHLRAALLNAELQLPPELTYKVLHNRISSHYKKAWIVHACKPYATGIGVAKYLARYMKGGPLQKARLFAASGKVKFRFKSHQSGQYETRLYRPDNLISLAVQHIAEFGQQTVRCYGLYNHCCEVKLNLARAHCRQQPVMHTALSVLDFLKQVDALPKCDICAAQEEENGSCE